MVKNCFLSLVCFSVLVLSCGPKPTDQQASAGQTGTQSPLFVQPGSLPQGTLPGHQTTVTTTPTGGTTSTAPTQNLKTFTATMQVNGATSPKANLIFQVLVISSPFTFGTDSSALSSYNYITRHAEIRNTYDVNKKPIEGPALDSTGQSWILSKWGLAPFDHKSLTYTRRKQNYRLEAAPGTEFHFNCVKDMSVTTDKGQGFWITRSTALIPPSTTWKRSELILRFLHSRTEQSVHSDIYLRGDIAEDNPYVRIDCSKFE